MTLLDFMRYALILLGVVYLTSMSAIMAPVRAPIARLSPFLILLIYCPVCTSFWVGALLTFVGISPFEHIRHWYDVILSGVIAVAITTVWYQIAYQGRNDAFQNEQPQFFTREDNDDASST